jgi:hypothetical protein
MDIFASKLLHLLSFAAVAAILISFCGVVIVIICLSRRRMDEPTLKRLAAIWVSAVLPLLLVVGGTMLLLHFSAWHRFNSMMTQKPNRLVITSEGKTNQIDDSLIIAEFYRIVALSKKVPAHHSHTVSDVKLLFPQTGYIYSLARDSQYPNEFWFGWNGIAGRERDWLNVGGSLGRLRSDELANWVEKQAR